MPPRCRVTFIDNAHQIRRSLEIAAALPLTAAETALQWLILNHVPPEDLAETVKIEVITTVECSRSLKAVEGRFQIMAPARAEAA